MKMILAHLVWVSHSLKWLYLRKSAAAIFVEKHHKLLVLNANNYILAFLFFFYCCSCTPVSILSFNVVKMRTGTYGFVNFLHSNERTHASFKRALEELCPVVRLPPELSEVIDAMKFYKTLHGAEDKKKQEAGSR